MGNWPPDSECAADYSVCRVYVPLVRLLSSGSGNMLRPKPLGGGQYLPEDYREEVPLMKTGMRILAVAVAFLMLVTGPLAPIAFAQQPSPVQPEPAAQPEPAPQQPPAPQPQPVAQPQPQQTMPQQPEPLRESRMAESAAYNVGAGIANIFYIPGKGILCAAGVASGVFIMLVTIGSAPRPAAYFAREGCGGRWYLVGDDLRPESEIRAFDWERDGTIRY